jgi:hypothetical protein
MGKRDYVCPLQEQIEFGAHIWKFEIYFVLLLENKHEKINKINVYLNS